MPAASSGTHTRWCRKQASSLALGSTWKGSTSQGMPAASSGTHTRWCRKQAFSLALSSAPVAAGQASSLALWLALSAVQRCYRRGAEEIPAGVSVTQTLVGWCLVCRTWSLRKLVVRVNPFPVHSQGCSYDKAIDVWGIGITMFLITFG